MHKMIFEQALKVPAPFLGADPEVFLKNLKGKGTFVSAHEAIPGTKEAPFFVKGGAVQVDGVAAEFNIDPAKTQLEFVNNIDQVMRTMDFMISKSMEDARIVIEPTAIFDAGYFKALPKKVKRLGCDPDFNAWRGGEVNVKPHTNQPMRTGAGHIHVGWTEFEDPHKPSHTSDCIQVVKQLDAALFVPSLCWDKDNQRRQLYGNLGAFRPKSYGVEYRVLSNRWIAHRNTIKWVYDASVWAFKLLEAGYHLYNHDVICDIMMAKEHSLKDIQKYEALLIRRGFSPFPD